MAKVLQINGKILLNSNKVLVSNSTTPSATYYLSYNSDTNTLAVELPARTIYTGTSIKTLDLIWDRGELSDGTYAINLKNWEFVVYYPGYETHPRFKVLNDRLLPFEKTGDTISIPGEQDIIFTRTDLASDVDYINLLINNGVQTIVAHISGLSEDYEMLEMRFRSIVTPL